MAILRAGTTLRSFDTQTSAVTTASNLPTAPVASVAEAISLTNAAGGPIMGFSPVSEAWISFCYYNASSTNGNEMFALRDAANNRPLFRLVASSGGTVLLQYYNGSTWTTLYSADVLIGASGTRRMDLFFSLGASGRIRWFVNGSEIYDSGVTNTIYNTSTAFSEMEWRRVGGSGSHVLSAVIVADESTINKTFIQTGITGDGDQTGWTGDYTDIDETGVNDADFLSTTTPDAVSTFTKGAIPGDYSSGYSVVGVGVTARARRGVDGAGNLRLVVDSAGDVAESGTKALTDGFAPVQHVFTEDPDTTDPWTIGAASAADVGVKSVV